MTVVTDTVNGAA